MAMVLIVPQRHSSDAAYLRLVILFVQMLVGIYVLWRGRDAAGSASSIPSAAGAPVCGGCSGRPWLAIPVL